MKMESFLLTLRFSLFGLIVLLTNNGYCQKWCPAKPYDYAKDAPKSINDECAKAEKKFREMLKKFNPKALNDPAVLRDARLKFESFWDGYLGTDSVRYRIIYYRCYDAGFLTVLRISEKGESVLVWKSSNIYSDRSSLHEPEDLTNDGRKEIIFYRSGGNSGNTPLYVYSWEGDSARLIGEIGGWPEIKDLDGDGVKEITDRGHAYAGDTFITSEVYKWDGKTYKLFKTEKVPVLIEDK